MANDKLIFVAVHAAGEVGITWFRNPTVCCPGFEIHFTSSDSGLWVEAGEDAYSRAVQALKHAGADAGVNVLPVEPEPCMCCWADGKVRNTSVFTLFLRGPLSSTLLDYVKGDVVAAPYASHVRYGG